MDQNVKIAKELIKLAREITAANGVLGLHAEKIENGSSYYINVRLSKGFQEDEYINMKEIDSFIKIIEAYKQMFDKVADFVKKSCPHLYPRWNIGNALFFPKKGTFEQHYECAGVIDPVNKRPVKQEEEKEVLEKEMDLLLHFING